MTLSSNSTPRYWQVAAGSDRRDYHQIFLRHGIAFVGGEAHIERMKDVRPGDVMILKSGLSEIVSVGRVEERDGRCSGNGDKFWIRDFDGWDLPAYCFVRWHQLQAPLNVPGLTRTTLQEVWKPEIRELVDHWLTKAPPAPAPHPEPALTRRIQDDDILEFLVRHGLRAAAADDLTVALRRIRLLAKYYYNECEWEDVREHETRTFLILPLLIALGWPEQRLKVELGIAKRQRIDIACFKRPYRRDADGQSNNQDCVLILESKGFGHGLDHASEQATGYSEGFPNCGTLIVSNGYCYKAYRRGSNGFSAMPTAYLNLLNPQDAYPVDPVNVRGSLDVLAALMPDA